MKKVILLSLLFLVPIAVAIVPTANAAIKVMDNFEHDPEFWEDWTKTRNSLNPTTDLEWNDNHTITIQPNTVGATHRYTKITRDFKIQDNEERIVVEAKLHPINVTGTDWRNGTFIDINYHIGATAHTCQFGITGTGIAFYTYNHAGAWTGTVYTFAGDASGNSANQEWHVEITIEDYYAQCEASNVSMEVMEVTREIEVDAHKMESLTLTQYTIQATTACVWWWVQAPFDTIDAIREWVGTNTGTEWYENPYWMRQSTAATDESFAVKVMPFQGYKTIVNWSMVNANGVQGGIRIRWYDRGGSLVTGYVGIWWYRDAGVFFLDFIYYDGATHIVTTVTVNREDAYCFTVWIDQADGKAYAYMQANPKSSEFTDYWVIEITDIVDFDSWGAIILHESVACGTASATAKWQEVEIFAGQKLGITQPRFGGMWWMYNPLLMAWVQIVTFLQIAFAVTLAPVITVIQAVITTLLDWLPTLGDIWGVISTVVVTMVTEFIDEFITPFVTVFFGYIVPNAILGIWLATMTVVNGVLEALGVLLFGDPNIIKNAVIGFMVAVQAFFGVIVTAISILTNTFFLLANLALGVPVVGVDLTGAISWINAIIYYVVTFAPIAVFLHLLTAIFRTVRAMDIMILVDASMFYLKIAEFLFNIVREVVSMVIQGVQVIMDIIPF